MKKEKIRKHQGMNRKGCFCVFAPLPSECRAAQHPTWRKIREGLLNWDQVVGRQGPAQHQEYAQIIWGVVFNVSSHLCGFCCGCDCM
jgi:hypothetical protein